MKMMLSLVVCLSVLLGVSQSTSVEPEQVHSQIQSYAQRRSVQVVAPRGSSNTLECYNTYLPQISAVAESGKEATSNCNTLGKQSREDEMAKVVMKRTTLNDRVSSIESSFGRCATFGENAILDYLNCLKADAQTNLEYIQYIAAASVDLYTDLNKAYANIDSTENSCIARVIVKAQKDTDDRFASLQRCLINGLQDPDPSDGGDDGGSDDGGSDAGGSDDGGSDDGGSDDGGSDDGGSDDGAKV